MIQSKEEFLRILQKELKFSPQTEELLQEFEAILTDMISEICLEEAVSEETAMEKVIERLGNPMEVAAAYKQEFNITPGKTQLTFIMVNVLFFMGGITLTLLYHLNLFNGIGRLWDFLTSIPFVIFIIYMFFWAFLGYEIGKEFGMSGKKLLHKTFYISLIPNLTLMALVLFRIIPTDWFQPLLTPAFIVACVVGTLLLLPICYISFRWGISRSI
jgi:hypothetical protein